MFSTARLWSTFSWIVVCVVAPTLGVRLFVRTTLTCPLVLPMATCDGLASLCNSRVTILKDRLCVVTVVAQLFALTRRDILWAPCMVLTSGMVVIWPL